jgi:hypothetical protein
MAILVTSVPNYMLFMLYITSHVTYCVWQGTYSVCGPTSPLCTVYHSAVTLHPPTYTTFRPTIQFALLQ